MNQPYRWLLLARKEQTLIQLYQQSENPDPVFLFAGTELEDCQDESPLLIDIQRNPGLLKALYQAPQDWPGLIIDSTHPKASLLLHLRQILIVRFDDGLRRAVLCYSNPTTASYFFPACTDPIREQWLGPIATLSWYGGTWRDLANNDIRWRQIDNPAARHWKVPKDKAPLHLAEQQTEALERQKLERFLLQWQQEHGRADFDQTWPLLQAGIDSGFTSGPGLSRYLELRCTHSLAFPLSELQGDERQRLDQLQDCLERQVTDKECL